LTKRSSRSRIISLSRGSLTGGLTTQSVFILLSPTLTVKVPATGLASLRSSA
jgi:hypothetical protein